MQSILILLTAFNPLPLGGEGLLCSPLAPREDSGNAPCSGTAFIRLPLAEREGYIEAGQIDTVAGSGAKGYTGDGGPGIKAALNQPFHCDVGKDGSLYIAEADNHCIRKLNLKTRVITTVAGTGKKGYSGDGGPAIKATFNEPYAVLVDSSDNLFVVDRLNAVVRRIDGSTGIITTVAGNGTKGFSGDGALATKAQLREPNDCCFDGKGGLLIADVGDWRVRRLDFDSGKITTFAGIGRPNPKGKPDRKEIGDGGPANKAILVGARAVAADRKGNIYICEREGSSIRKIDSAGVITTLAGTGAWGGKGDGGDALKAEFKGPKGIRLDRAGNLFIVDTENHSIRRIDAKTNIVTTIAGGRKGPGGDGGPATDAGMARPHGCVVDADGYLYVADSENHRVRRIKLP